MNTDFINAEHNHRIDKARNEYRRANNPADRPRTLKTVAAIAVLVAIPMSFVVAQRAPTDQAPPAASVHMVAR